MHSPSNKSSLFDLFPSLHSDKEALLFELYNGDVNEVIDAMLKGVTATTLLQRIQMLKLTTGTQHIQVRPDHKLEDGLRCLYKGNFNVSMDVKVEFAVYRFLFGNVAEQISFLQQKNFLATAMTCSAMAASSGVHIAKLPSH